MDYKNGIVTTIALQEAAHRSAIARPYWLEAAHYLKRAALARSTRQFGGLSFRVSYETRTAADEVEFGLLKRGAAGVGMALDIGANVGASSLVMASSMKPGGKLYAFEASEASCMVIRENSVLNNLSDRIEVINAVVAERSGIPMSFHLDGFSPRSSVLMASRSDTSCLLHKATLSVDDFVEETGVQPELIKIDVEGAEAQVLAGMVGVLDAHRPPVVLEMHAYPQTSLADNVEQVLKILSRVNYRMIDVGTVREVSDVAVYAHLGTNETSVQARAQVVLTHTRHPIPTWMG